VRIVMTETFHIMDLMQVHVLDLHCQFNIILYPNPISNSFQHSPASHNVGIQNGD